MPGYVFLFFFLFVFLHINYLDNRLILKSIQITSHFSVLYCLNSTEAVCKWQQQQQKNGMKFQVRNQICGWCWSQTDAVEQTGLSEKNILFSVLRSSVRLFSRWSQLALMMVCIDVDQQSSSASAPLCPPWLHRWSIRKLMMCSSPWRSATMGLKV